MEIIGLNSLKLDKSIGLPSLKDEHLWVRFIEFRHNSCAAFIKNDFWIRFIEPDKSFELHLLREGDPWASPGSYK